MKYIDHSKQKERAGNESFEAALSAMFDKLQGEQLTPNTLAAIKLEFKAMVRKYNVKPEPGMPISLVINDDVVISIHQYDIDGN